MPTATGSAAATRPPNAQTSTRKLNGIASDSMTSRSRCDCSVIWTLTIAVPPERTVTPSWSSATWSDNSLAYFCWWLSSPVMPATMSPDVRSRLTRSAAADGGAVHGDVTWATCSELRSWSTIWLPAARAGALSTPSGVETTISNCTSPRWNFSVRNRVAAADSAVGSWNPLADKLFATGTPNIPRATVSNTANTMTRRGAAMASRAIRCSSVCPPLRVSVLKTKSVGSRSIFRDVRHRSAPRTVVPAYCRRRSGRRGPVTLLRFNFRAC